MLTNYAEDQSFVKNMKYGPNNFENHCLKHVATLVLTSIDSLSSFRKDGEFYLLDNLCQLNLSNLLDAGLPDQIPST